MLIQGKPYRTIWVDKDERSVCILDQRQLPFRVVEERLRSLDDMVRAIRDMHVRGAPLIGAAAAWGVWLACLELAGNTAGACPDTVLPQAFRKLLAARPTAVNLRWALERQQLELTGTATWPEAIRRSRALAESITEEDVSICAGLGRYGADRLERLLAEKRDRGDDSPLRLLTHCNAGWLATVDHGTATAAMYEASRRGVPLHVWVDETRPRNQGAMTAWELSQNGVANTVVCDNTGGHLMQQGLVDAVIVGTDRTARNGDAANKIGTYLKALAAHDNGIPFFVALPSPSFDARLEQGVGRIPIEKRDPEEVLCVRGRVERGDEGPPDQAAPELADVRLFARGTEALNYGFDVTPARLITAFITEYGIFKPEDLAAAMAALAPDPAGPRPAGRVCR